MIVILGLFVLVGLTAGIAITAAFVLEAITPQTPWKLRAIWAALAGGMIPMLLPLFTLVFETSLSDGGLIPAVTILIAGLVASLLIGFPSAFLFLRNREASVDKADRSGVFE